MKDVFTARSRKAFWDLMDDFAASLEATFPDCADTKDWCLWMRNVIATDESKHQEGIELWFRNIETPLAKGCAKYGKAVQSITGKPACVYHAIAYHDADAAHASMDERLRGLDMPAKVGSAAMDDAARAIFWQYLEELNKHARALRKSPPAVPSSAEIAATSSDGAAAARAAAARGLQGGHRCGRSCASRGNAEAAGGGRRRRAPAAVLVSPAPRAAPWATCRAQQAQGSRGAARWRRSRRPDGAAGGAGAARQVRASRSWRRRPTPCCAASRTSRASWRGHEGRQGLRL